MIYFAATSGKFATAEHVCPLEGFRSKPSSDDPRGLDIDCCVSDLSMFGCHLNERRKKKKWTENEWTASLALGGMSPVLLHPLWKEASPFVFPCWPFIIRSYVNKDHGPFSPGLLWFIFRIMMVACFNSHITLFDLKGSKQTWTETRVQFYVFNQDHLLWLDQGLAFCFSPKASGWETQCQQFYFSSI